VAKKFTYEEVKTFIEIESESSCKLISKEYVNIDNSISIRCNCGCVFITTFKQFRHSNKRQCNKCGYEASPDKQKKLYDDVKHFIEVDSSSGCKLLSNEYLGSKSQLLIECKCGRHFSTQYKSFKHNEKQQCGVCSGVNYDIKYVDEFVNKNSDCILISSVYISALEPLEFKCGCGCKFTTNFNIFVLGNKRHCDKCGFENSSRLQRLDYSYVKEYINKSGCTLLSDEYKNQNQNLNVKCKCGEVYSVNFNNFKNKNRTQCRACSNLIKWDYLKVKKYIEDDSNSRCKLLSSRYKNNMTELNLVCKCGNKFTTTFTSFKEKNKRQCSPCGYSKSKNNSKGELRIEDYLMEHSIKFNRERVFSDLIGVGGGLLRFDFAILDDSNKEACLIEYDGEFHFKKFYEEQNFEELQEHDRRKNQYCKDDNIPLIRIPYWQFDRIEEILNKWLNEYKLI